MACALKGQGSSSLGGGSSLRRRAAAGFLACASPGGPAGVGENGQVSSLGLGHTEYSGGAKTRSPVKGHCSVPSPGHGWSGPRFSHTHLVSSNTSSCLYPLETQAASRKGENSALNSKIANIRAQRQVGPTPFSLHPRKISFLTEEPHTLG